MDIIEDTKIVFVDIDGTLTNSEREITDKTKKKTEQHYELFRLFVLLIQLKKCNKGGGADAACH